MKYTEQEYKYLNDFYTNNGLISYEDVDFFTSTFIIPPRFNEIYRNFKPSKGRIKIILIDGHPRTGKTWLAQSLICRYISENNCTNDIWHSGVDSCQIFENTEETIFDGLKFLEKEFNKKENNNKKIFFLDDFYGTNSMRSFGVNLHSKNRLIKYLNYSKNPIIDSLPKGSTLLITSRSLYVHILYRTVGLDIPFTRIPINKFSTFTPVKWGVFQTFDSSQVTGSFDHPTINNILRNISKYIVKTKFLLKDFTLNAPIIRFSKDFPMNNKSVDQDISDMFFGDDIDTLKEHIIKIKDEATKYGKVLNGDFKELYDHFSKLYFLIISPSLFYYNKKLFESLKIEEKEFLSFSHALYYSINEINNSPFPSKFYFIAVSKHINKSLDFVISIIEYLFSKGDYPITNIFRGIAELALSDKTDWDIHDLKTNIKSTKLKKKFERTIKDDFILSMEFHSNVESDIGFPKESKPIFFSYSSWLINKLLSKDDHYNEILPAYRNKFIKYFTNEILSNENQEEVADKLFAGFSTFLQWTLKNNKINPETIEKEGTSLFRILQKKKNVIRKINMILEDELIWALFEKRNTSDERTPPETLIKIDYIKNNFLKSFEKCIFSKIEYREANRYFSLIWHNEWMMPSTEKVTTQYYPTISKWCDSFHNFILSKNSNIETLAEVLYSNFNYHWYHFITQRSIWLRDWSLSDDPLETEKNYETTQITMGSDNSTDHKKLVELINHLSNNIPLNSEYRNVIFKSSFFFISLRTRRIEKDIKLQLEVEQYRHRIAKELKDRNTKKSIIVASFELARHGFFQPWSKIISQKHKDFIKVFIHKNKGLLEEAWIEYYNELNLCLDEFDFIPREKNGWKEIFPKDYYNN